MNGYCTEINVFHRPKCVIRINIEIYILFIQDTGSKKCTQHNWKQKVNNIFSKTWLHSFGWIRLIFFVYVLYGGLCTILIDFDWFTAHPVWNFQKEICCLSLSQIQWALLRAIDLHILFQMNMAFEVLNIEHWTLTIQVMFCLIVLSFSTFALL